MVPAPFITFCLLFQGFFFFVIVSRNQRDSDMLKWQNTIGDLVQQQNTKCLSAFKYVFSLNRKQIPNLKLDNMLLTSFPPYILFWDLFSPWAHVWNLCAKLCSRSMLQDFFMMCCDRLKIKSPCFKTTVLEPCAHATSTTRQINQFQIHIGSSWIIQTQWGKILSLIWPTLSSHASQDTLITVIVLNLQ